jgi:hypothetical protein
MNEYKVAWLTQSGQLSQNIIDDVKETYNKVKEKVVDWHNTPPTSPKRLIAHLAAIPIAVGADALASGVLLTYAGPGWLAVGASLVALAALAYFLYSAYQLYSPYVQYFIENSDLKYIFA